MRLLAFQESHLLSKSGIERAGAFEKGLQEVWPRLLGDTAAAEEGAFEPCGQGALGSIGIGRHRPG